MEEMTIPQTAEKAFDLDRAMQDYGTDLLRLCTLYLGDRALAEDAVQDTFFRAWRSGGFRGESGEKTWLTRIAINVCKRYLRSSWKLCRAPADELDTLFADTGDPQVDDTLPRAIMALSRPYREVIILYYYQELKAREIADILHVDVSTVTARLSRARKQLREALKGWYYDE